MAQMFHALVVMGGSLVACGGRSTDDAVMSRPPEDQTASGEHDSETSQTNTQQTSQTSTEENTSGGNANLDDPVSAGTTPSYNNSASSSIGGQPPGDSQPEPSSESPPGSGGAGTNTAGGSSGDGTIILDPKPIEPNNPTPGPAECPPAQWLCETKNCVSDNTKNCGGAWDGEQIDTCPMLPGPCECSPDPAPSAEDCSPDEVYTCAVGEFDTGGEQPELLNFDCRCVPHASNCEATCETHSATGYNSACVEQEALVLCGGCIWSGILR